MYCNFCLNLMLDYKKTIIYFFNVFEHHNTILFLNVKCFYLIITRISLESENSKNFKKLIKRFTSLIFIAFFTKWDKLNQDIVSKVRYTIG